MLIGYDPKKSAINSRERGLPFDLVVDLVWETAIVVEDARRDYGERRMRAILYDKSDEPHVVVFTIRGPLRWIISFRGTRETERRLHD